MAKPEQPQIYVYLTSGGILEYEVMRGDIDVVMVDWDENMERDIDDWEEVRGELERLVPSALRDQELKSVDDEIEELRDWEREREAAEQRREQNRLEEARRLLREAGELPDGGEH